MTRDHRVWRLVAAAVGSCAGALVGLKTTHGVGWGVAALIILVGVGPVPVCLVRVGRGSRGGPRGERRGVGGDVRPIRPRTQVALWCLAAFGVGAISAGWHLARVRSGPVAALGRSGSASSAVLQVTRDPFGLTTAGGSAMWLVDAVVLDVPGPGAAGWAPVRSPALVFGFNRGWQGLVPGQRVIASGRWRPAQFGDDVSAVFDATGAPTLIGRPPWWQRWADRARLDLAAACAQLPPNERALVPALVLGVVSPLPASVQQDFRVTGLTHLIAVSGENLAIVFVAVFGLVRLIGLRRWIRGILLTLTVVTFVLVARPSPSVLRAAAIGAVAVVALMAGRRGQPLAALALAVTGLVVVDPWLVTDVGFGLSVSATAGIVVLAPPIAARLRRRLPRLLAQAIAVPAAAQLACTPLLVGAFHQLTPYAVPANLIAGIAVPAATLVGIAVAVLAVPVPVVARALAWIAAAPAAWIVGVAHAFARVPGAAATLPTSPWVDAMVATLLGLGAAAVSARAFWRERRTATASANHAILER